MFCKFRPLLSIRATKPLSLLKNVEGPVFVRTAPGSRCLELGHLYEGNYITEDTLRSLSHNLQKIEENHTVGLMIVASRSPDRFSDGLVRTASGVSKTLVKAANSLSLSISTMNKESIAVFSGVLDDTAYSTFASCKYRLGTETTSITLNTFKNGRLHVGGGLPYYFARGSPVGQAYLRYLSVTNRSINAYDMHALGLLTHITEEEPQNNLQFAIGHIIGPNDFTKTQQSSGVDTFALSELLDTMHVLDDELTDGDSGDSGDIMKHEAWSKVFLIPPTCEETSEVGEGLVELRDNQKEIEHCFGTDSVEDCRQRLRDAAASHFWAKEALSRMDTYREGDLKEWFRLTDQTSKATLSSQLEEEERVHALLVDSNRI